MEDDMPEELTPNQPSSEPDEALEESSENLADSDDPEVLKARAKVLAAEAKLQKAKQPLFDKIVLRGLIPIALAIVGPWALWKFDKAQVEQQRQGTIIVQLQDLLEKSREEGTRHQEQRAVELASMSNMVIRLDNLLKLALVRMAVSEAIGQQPRGPSGVLPMQPMPPARNQVVQDAAQQIQLPGVDQEEFERLAGEQYDRIMEQRQVQQQRE
jgi:hypothetical protein